MHMCRPYIVVKDFEDFLSKKDAADAFNKFDAEHTGRLTFRNMQDAVLAIFRCDSTKVLLVALVHYVADHLLAEVAYDHAAT